MLGLVLALVLLAADPPPVLPSAPAAEAVLGFADDLLRRGDAQRAAGEYTRYLYVCGSCPRAPYAQLKLAEALRLSGQDALAGRPS